MSSVVHSIRFFLLGSILLCRCVKFTDICVWSCDISFPSLSVMQDYNMCVDFEGVCEVNRRKHYIVEKDYNPGVAYLWRLLDGSCGGY
jgi:hypothetical protein